MTDPEIFILRVWREHAGRFRASARRVDDDETHHFSQPDDLARFLGGGAEPGAAADETVAAPVPGETTP